MYKNLENIFLGTLIFLSLTVPNLIKAEEILEPTLINEVSPKVEVFVFGREDCSFCIKEKNFLENLIKERDDFQVYLIDINTDEGFKQFDLITKQLDLPQATPVTVIGKVVLQGFNSPETTGQQIISLIEQAKSGQLVENIGDLEIGHNFEFNVPFLGKINAKDFSLFSLSFILGLVDGFNPCAMWVLMTFLLILWQVKDRKKMFQVAGLFILAETVMYWLILNFWYKTWNFIGLDKIITPAVGLLAVSSGIYFIYRYWKNRGKLVCDTDIEKQSKTETKIRALIENPLTWLSALGIIGVALSVNIIEFACSIGIPQAFTKILELNKLTLLIRQFYIFLYTLAYMIDDILIFGLALYGFNKFYAVGQKYSNLSSLIGGLLMLILGALLLWDPSILVF
ncbi:MAG: glutaredoxin [Patescibacteria group bacterium]